MFLSIRVEFWSVGEFTISPFVSHESLEETKGAPDLQHYVSNESPRVTAGQFLF